MEKIILEWKVRKTETTGEVDENGEPITRTRSTTSIETLDICQILKIENKWTETIIYWMNGDITVIDENVNIYFR